MPTGPHPTCELHQGRKTDPACTKPATGRTGSKMRKIESERHNLVKCEVVRIRVPVGERLRNALWGLLTGIAAGVTVGWLAEAPWISYRLGQLASWISAWHFMWNL